MILEDPANVMIVIGEGVSIDLSTAFEYGNPVEQSLPITVPHLRRLIYLTFSIAN